MKYNVTPRGYARGMEQRAAISRAATLAARRHGVLTAAELRGCGLTDRMVDGLRERGLLVGLAPGVHRWQGSTPTWRQQALAAVRAAGPSSLLSHQSAAALHELAGFRPGALHVVVPLDVVRTSRRATVRRSDFRSDERTVVDGIPVVSVPLALVQVAATTSAARLEDAVDDALCRRLVTAADLTSSCRRGRAGSVALRAVAGLWLAGDRPGSLAEARLVRRLMAHALPKPVLQHEVSDGEGRGFAKLDLAWPDQRVAVELDSFRWHGARRSHGATARRRNRLEARGWHVLVATTDDLDDGAQRLATSITALLDGPGREAASA